MKTFKKFIAEADPLDHFQLSQFLKRVLKLDDHVDFIITWMLNPGTPVSTSVWSYLIMHYKETCGDPSVGWQNCTIGENVRRLLFQKAKETGYW